MRNYLKSLLKLINLHLIIGSLAIQKANFSLCMPMIQLRYKCGQKQKLQSCQELKLPFLLAELPSSNRVQGSSLS